MNNQSSHGASPKCRQPGLGASPSVLPALPPGIPDHKLIRRIGQGSYGEVWLAQSVTDTFRAVKVVQRRAFADARPYEREFAGIKHFEPLSRTHVGFVSILHVGRNETAGYFYSIMELADDANYSRPIHPQTYEPRTLANELARRGKLPIDECVSIGLSLASALTELHRHKLLHRDLKPSNIIFVNGVPKLADVGLVAVFGDGTTSLGTRGYAPPEDPGHPTADLYSLGKVLYQISTGKGPECFPELPTNLGLSGDEARFLRLNDTLLRLCDRNPQKRYQTAEALRAALGQCQRTVPGKPSEPSLRGINTAVRSQRKLLTVLLVNLIRTERSDPERAQSFMQACLEPIRKVLDRFGGTIAQVLSDGVLGIFGGQIACEDHARRAAHASLAVRQVLDSQRLALQSRYGFGFQLRISLNTDLSISAEGGAEPPTGDLVDLATRVVPHLESGQIAMTEATHRFVKDYFLLHSLADRDLPGRALPVKLYGVTGAREMRTRLEAGAERGLTPFVGRGREMAFLAERFAEARAGRGQIVLLAGEAGVGKSRLLFEFQRSLGVEEVTWLAGRSISYGSQMAFLPIVDMLRSLFHIAETEDLQTIGERIKTFRGSMGDEVLAALPQLSALLSASASQAGAQLSAEQRRVEIFEALRNLVVGQAQRGPVVLVVEDLHWVDRSSEEFLVWLADAVTMAPVMMLLSYRPEYRHRFSERSYVSHLVLRQLTNEESLEMAGRLLTVSHLPDQLRNLVVSKAEGNPFFVEEMLKSLLETGALARGVDHGEPSEPRWAQVPDTIQDLILSRIGHLEQSPRRALQFASVIGREFSVPLLETIADLDEPLLESLRQLQQMELIYERSVFPEHTCIFKHALTQEVAYNSLLVQQRKELHCLVAAAVEELYSERLPDFYGLLAYHYQGGEEWERALDYLQRAAARCRQLGAHREEALHLGRVIAIAQQLNQPDVAAHTRGQRGIAWVKCGLWAQALPELKLALADLGAEDCGRRAELLCGLAGASFWALDTGGTQQYAAEGHALAEKAGREDLVAELLTYLGASQQALGDLTAATDFFERARAKGGGCFSAALANYPLTLYLHGHLQAAMERAQEAAEKFRSLSDMFAATFGHPHFGLTLAACGRYSEAEQVFEEARQMGKKHEIWPFHARAVAMSAGFHLDVYDMPGHEALAEEAREHARSAAFRPSEVSAAIDLIFNFARRGEVARAGRLAHEAQALKAEIGGWHQWLWTLRLKQAEAELACARGQWSRTVDLATEAILASQARGRAKYVVAGLETRAQALAKLGRTHAAIADLRQAAGLTRAMGDPALFLRAASPLLSIDGDDLLLSEVRETAVRILHQLPNADMRQRFQAAEPVRQLGPLPANLEVPEIC